LSPPSSSGNESLAIGESAAGLIIPYKVDMLFRESESGRAIFSTKEHEGEHANANNLGKCPLAHWGRCPVAGPVLNETGTETDNGSRPCGGWAGWRYTERRWRSSPRPPGRVARIHFVGSVGKEMQTASMKPYRVVKLRHSGHRYPALKSASMTKKILVQRRWISRNPRSPWRSLRLRRLSINPDAAITGDSTIDSKVRSVERSQPKFTAQPCGPHDARRRARRRHGTI